MGLFRKLVSIQTLGAVDFRSDKERIARYSKASMIAERQQLAVMQAALQQQVKPVGLQGPPSTRHTVQDANGVWQWADETHKVTAPPAEILPPETQPQARHAVKTDDGKWVLRDGPPPLFGPPAPGAEADKGFTPDQLAAQQARVAAKKANRAVDGKSTALRILIAPAIAIVIGTFLPWITFDSFRISGVNIHAREFFGDGTVVVGLAILVAGLAWRGASRSAAVVVIGLTAIVCYDVQRISNVTGPGFAQPGVGLWICGVGTATALGIVLVQWALAYHRSTAL